MRLSIATRWLPRAGNSCAEYEDAFWPVSNQVREGSTFRCAIADGASESSFAQLWAEMLAHAWGAGELARRRFEATLARLERAWLDDVGKRPLPWYAEEKVRSGAFSSLLGLGVTVRKERGMHWQAVAVGDSCLFHMTQGSLATSFPLSRSDQFHNRPHLLCSRIGSGRVAADRLLRAHGSCERGDVFYLMTDALACWFLAIQESGERSWQALDEVFDDQGLFSEWVAGLRADGTLRNDDVTAMRIQID